MSFVLAIRTDQAESELVLYKEHEQIDAFTWEAGRTLSDTLLTNILSLLDKNKTDVAGLRGIIVYKGPGSFTGLRIGASVANTIAFAQKIPIVSTQTEDWQDIGLKRLQNNENDKIVLPDYGGEANITKPRK